MARTMATAFSMTSAWLVTRMLFFRSWMASRAGFNLSGLIATSAMLTALSLLARPWLPREAPAPTQPAELDAPAATLTPAPQVAVADQSQSALLRTGQQLYETACITCHGANLQGVQGRGPSLIGVGEASVFFQVSTGRMPLAAPINQAPRKAPIYSEEEIAANPRARSAILRVARRLSVAEGGAA